jgi:ABC-type transporter Mla subunit MlaD
MPRLGDIRKLFRPRKPMALDYSAALENGAAVQGQSNGAPPAIHAEGESVLTIERDQLLDMPRLDVAPQRGPAQSSREVVDMMTLVRLMNEHMELQRQRGDDLMNALHRLPQTLESLPEINRQSSRLMEILAAHLGGAKPRDEALSQAMHRLTDVGAHLTDVLGLLLQQLDRNADLASGLSKDVANVRLMAGHLVASSDRCASQLADFRSEASARSADLGTTLVRNQYWMIAAVFLCAVSSAAGLAMALVALTRN